MWLPFILFIKYVQYCFFCFYYVNIFLYIYYLLKWILGFSKEKSVSCPSLPHPPFPAKMFQTPNKSTEQVTWVQLVLYSLKDGISFVALSTREKKGQVWCFIMMIEGVGILNKILGWVTGKGACHFLCNDKVSISLNFGWIC